MPTCDACGSVVRTVTIEEEDELCDLCADILRYDRQTMKLNRTILAAARELAGPHSLSGKTGPHSLSRKK